MRILFMGSAGFACPCLETLLRNNQDEVVGVVTQPDRPKGRNLQLSSCPVKTYLGSHQIPVLSPEKINTSESLAAIRTLHPDLMVVVAYGQLLKSALLEMAPLGIINVHGSLLPKYRGAAPIQWAVANGDTISGVTTMYLNERMDAGDMILKRELPIDPADTGGSYHDKLALVGAELLNDTVDLIRQGRAPREVQNENEATVAPKLKKSDGRIDWTLPADIIRAQVQGFNPWPGSFCVIPADGGKIVKVLTVRAEAGTGIPGTLIALGGEGPLIQAGHGRALRLLEVQPEGRKPMSGTAFLCGHALQVGMRAG
ncbi:MAG: methionyl-tRNA formyltransferase [bacterium]|jgi:methionyl-tRNA formyltransferase